MDSLLRRGSCWHPIDNVLNTNYKLISARGMMGRVKGEVSLLLFSCPRLLSDVKRPLRRREKHGIINKCSEKASISVSLLFIDIDFYLQAPAILELFLQILLLNMSKLMVAVLMEFFLMPPPHTFFYIRRNFL